MTTDATAPPTDALCASVGGYSGCGRMIATQAMMDVGECLAKLATCGSPRQIGEYLVSRGIDLRCESLNWDGNCPVARYVQVETGHKVLVNTRWVWLSRGGQSVRLPSPVPRFVTAFDDAADRTARTVHPSEL